MKEADLALAAALSAGKKWPEAEPLLLSLAASDPSSRRIVQQIVDLYAAWGKPGKAAEWQAKLPR